MLLAIARYMGVSDDLRQHLSLALVWVVVLCLTFSGSDVGSMFRSAMCWLCGFSPILMHVSLDQGVC
jgi:hypothetical protein